MMQDFCRRRNVSVAEIALELGVSRSAAANWMDGNTLPNQKHLAQLSELMCEPLGTLILAKRRVQKSRKM